MSNYVVLPKDLNRFVLIVGCLFLTLIFNTSLLSAYTNDITVYAPPAYLTFQPPPAGGSYTDAVFGAAVKRLTNAMTTPDAARGSGVVTSITPEYSTMTPFNLDNTRLLLAHFSYFGLYDGAGNFLRSLPFEINTSAEPRWSRTDANVIYYVSGNRLKQYNIGTNSMTVVHAFTEYSRISGKGESDICFDGDHFVLAGDSRYVFVYEISTDTKRAVFDTGGHAFDSIYITPNDNVTITWLTNGSSRYNGIELFDTNMNFVRQLTHAGGHMDVTRDVDGDEVLVWVNAADAQLRVPCDAGITKVRLSDGQQTCIWRGDWSLAAHVSAPDGNGWVFIETYAPSDPIPPSGWNLYTNEFLQVKLDGTEVRRVAHHRSRRFNSYTWQPKLSTSRDGSKVVFGSNFGLQAILGYPTEYSDAYLIDITTAPTTSVPTSTPSSPSSATVALKASFLGVTGQDYVGTGDRPAANGNPDWHIQLQGLREAPTRVRITSDTGGMWEAPFTGTCWLVLSEYGSTGNADLWFEPASGNGFHVKVWYSDGSTVEADAASSVSSTPSSGGSASAGGGSSSSSGSSGSSSPAPPSANPGPLKAFYLGVTGQDYVGTSDRPAANGNPDWHIQLQGLRGAPTRVRITSDTGGMWEAPFAGTCWIVLAEYGATGNADVWFEPASGQSFHVKVWYSDGSTSEADAASGGSATASSGSSGSSSSAQPSANAGPLRAFYLGVTGQDYVGTAERPGANNNPDWHIQLQGLKGTPTRVQVTSNAGGLWEAPFTGMSWIVLFENGATGNADLWFEPASGQRFHVKVWYSDGSTDEVDTI